MAEMTDGDDGRNVVELNCRLNEDEAWALAQFLKRVGFSDYRANAVDDDEAYVMRNAGDRVAVALREIGVAPR